ncbi:MAG: trans-sulfuration enzyme family protein, partial [Rubripirellula sp.]
MNDGNSMDRPDATFSIGEQGDPDSPLADSDLSFRTRSIHVGNETDPQTGAVVPPIHFASTFRQPGAGEWGEFDYSRSGNPTRSNLQKTLASLEGGCDSLAFSSGMAAIHCVAMMLNQGEHVVAGCDLYGGAHRLLHQICDRSGIDVTLVDLTDPDAVTQAVRSNTRLIWAESIGNPRLSIPDMRELAGIAKKGNALLGVDNTFATPCLLRPLELGADIVM